MSKRLLITTSTFPPRKNGVSHVVAAHAYGLARAGHDVTVATGYEPDRKEPPQAEVAVRPFRTWGNAQLGRGGYRGDVSGYQSFLASFEADLVICHCWQIWSTDLVVRAFDKIKCPKVLVSHGVSGRFLDLSSVTSTINWLAWKPYLRKLPGMLKAFDHVVLLSERMDTKGFFDHSLMHKVGYDSHSVIPNGVFQDRFTNGAEGARHFRTKYGIGDRPMLLYVSNFDIRKNQWMAVRAFIEADVADSVLVLIGSEKNDYARRLESFVRKRPAIRQRILLLEGLDQAETVSAFQATDLFLCSSRWEHQPLVILEAMAAAKPFVCTDVGCVRELPGGMVTSGTGEMVRAIRALMANEALRRELGSRGQAAIGERYNWPEIVGQYDALIETVCRKQTLARKSLDGME